MDPIIKAAWLHALLSDDYKPNTNGFLATRPDDDTTPLTYNPLAVLCELAIQAGIQLTKLDTYSDRVRGHIVVTYDGEPICLPPAVTQWAQIDRNPYVRWARQSGISNLAFIGSRNADGTFKEVAALIENNL